MPIFFTTLLDIPYLGYRLVTSKTTDMVIIRPLNYVYHSYKGFVYDAL